MKFITPPARKKLSAIIFLISLTFLFFTQTSMAADNNFFDTLKEKLVSDGFKKSEIQKIYSSPNISFDVDGVSLFFIHNEGSLDYEQFVSNYAIWRAKNYLKKHRHDFSRVSRESGVDKTVITAIMLVETGLGTYTGNRSVINTLSTMAALSDLNVRMKLLKSIKDERRLPLDKYHDKADSKSAWAYNELKAFLKYVKRENLDPHNINGSYAGAMGYAQFMPSNVISLAKDGNRDGKIDLFNHSDAIASVANYLKHHGWHSEIDRQGAEEVLYAYNHSEYYVDILLKISELLKG